MGLTEVSVVRTDQHQEVEMPEVSEAIDILPLPPQLSCNPACVFSNISESEERSKAATKLSGLILFYLVFMAVEIVGGLKANSLAVLTDAAHLLTDVAGCFISLFTLWVSGWKPTPRQSFGFNRLEVLGALLSVQLIWLVSGMLIYEAVNRILHKNSKVNGKLMFAVAAFGFLINLIMAFWLGHNHDHHHHHACGDEHDHHHHDHDHHHHHDHDHEKEGLCETEEENTKLVSNSPKKKFLSLNINLQGAYLHVISDMIQSVGVMIAGAIIWAKPDWLIVDLVCTLVFSVLVLSTTLAMLRNVFGILMERTPTEIDISRLEKDLKGVKGVEDVHDLHVWAITVGKFVMSCHVIAEPGTGSNELLGRIRDYCEKMYRIQHVTIQIES